MYCAAQRCGGVAGAVVGAIGEDPEVAASPLGAPGVVCMAGWVDGILGSPVIAPELGGEPFSPPVEAPFGFMVGVPGVVGDIEELVPVMGAAGAGWL